MCLFCRLVYSINLFTISNVYLTEFAVKNRDVTSNLFCRLFPMNVLLVLNYRLIIKFKILCIQKSVSCICHYYFHALFVTQETYSIHLNLDFCFVSYKKTKRPNPILFVFCFLLHHNSRAAQSPSGPE